MTGVIAFDVAELRSLGPLPFGRGCDFCAIDVPRYRYPAHDVELGAIVYGPTVVRPISVGVWEACEDCSDLVEAGDWPALARRTLRSLNLDLSRAGPGVRVRLLAQIRCMHEAFRRARYGTRREAAA